MRFLEFVLAIFEVVEKLQKNNELKIKKQEHQEVIDNLAKAVQKHATDLEMGFNVYLGSNNICLSNPLKALLAKLGITFAENNIPTTIIKLEICQYAVGLNGKNKKNTATKILITESLLNFFISRNNTNETEIYIN